MITVNKDISLDESEIEFRFIRASGPGGQNVNKVSSAVQLRFDVGSSASLPGDVRTRLIRLAGRRVNQDGILTIEARRERSQERNREEAVERLAELIRLAALKPKTRKKTKPTRAAKEKRIAGKKQRGEVKKIRSKSKASLDTD